jgi:hypothetical protein
MVRVILAKEKAFAHSKSRLPLFTELPRRDVLGNPDIPGPIG